MECWNIISFLVISAVLSPTQQNVITVDCNSAKDANQMINNNSHFCRTLQCALMYIENDSIVQILNGTCHLNNVNTTVVYNNISIIGSGPNSTIIQCAYGAGFGFLNVTNICISKLTLLGCGELRKSTTLNISSEGNSTMLFRVCLYFLNVVNVTMDAIVVANSTGMGVAMYDVTGKIKVANSTFINNKVLANESNMYPGGGGFSVEFTFSKPGVVELSDATEYTNTNNNSSYIFYNCTFLQNIASTINVTATTYANSTYGFGNLQFGRGGGLSVFFKGKAVNNTIEIDKCNFTENYALWGGGFHSDIVDHSNNNVLLITESKFSDNHCHIYDTVQKGYFSVSTGGGAIRIALLFSNPQATVNSNVIEINQCRFLFNSAYYGGGVSCTITKESNRAMASNNLTFTDCKWNNNKARTGSAVDLAAHPFPLGIAPVVPFKNCTFLDNSNHYSESIDKPVGIGTLYSDNIPIDFEGTCKFMNNKGTALAGSASFFSFKNNSMTMFDNNNGSNGGAMALLGNTYLILYHNTTIWFVNNRAASKGGAIYFTSSSEREFISTQKCFLFYYDMNADQAHWKTSLYFKNNTDLSNISIFCTTILPCVWGNIPDSTMIKNSAVTSLFNETFQFNDNPQSLIGNNSMTDAIRIVKFNETYSLAIPPGKMYKLNITLFDEMDNKVYPVLFLQTSNPNVMIDSACVYIFDDKIRLYGDIGSNASLQLQTVSGRPWSLTINVTLAECPPGLIYNTTGVANNKRCICGTSTYYGVYRCNPIHSVAYIYPQFWAGIISHKGSLIFVTADCPEGYCNTVKKFLKLPTSLSLKANDEYQTKQCLHRYGILCGKCNDEYYVAANSLTYECTKNCKHNSSSNILKLLLLKYVPFTFFLLVVIFFNISLVDGPLNSFILFSQIINPIGAYANKIALKVLTSQQQKILSDIYYLVYGPWNLNFFEMLVAPFCGYRYDSTIKVLALEYISALYPVFLFLLFYSIIPCVINHVVLSNVGALRMCLLRGQRMFIIFRRSWSVKNSIIHGLTTFLVLSYARVTSITGLLLASTTLYGNLNTEGSVKTVVWLDGTMQYFGTEHLPFAILACVVLMTVVLIPPLLLLSYPLVPILLNKMDLQDKWIFRHLIIAPLDKCVPFFDAFQSCFKNEYRYFAGLYFLYRAIACGVLIFSWQWTTQLIYQQFFFLLIILVHCICQPYHERKYNILDGTIFIILAAINSIALYNAFLIEMNLDTLLSFVWIQLLLVYAPFMCITIFFFYHIFKWCLPQAKRSLLQRLSRNSVVSVPRDNDEMPARLLSTDGSSTVSTSSNHSSSSETNDTSQSECSDESDDDQEREMDQFMQCNDLNVQMISGEREFRRFTT